VFNPFQPHGPIGPQPSAALVPAGQKDAVILQLAGQVRTVMTPAVSTMVSGGASFLAGMIDGSLGENNKLGPVRLNPAIGVGFGILGFFIDDPDLAEAANAASRGFLIPAGYAYGVDAGKRIAKPSVPAIETAAKKAA